MNNSYGSNCAMIDVKVSYLLATLFKNPFKKIYYYVHSRL